MTGLNLISTYTSESEDSDEETHESSASLPLPASIKSWKGVIHHEDVIDDPSSHKGRIRTFKHERGNWATLIYINYTPSDNMCSWIKSAVSQISFEGNALLEQLHISVTHTLILKFHWIDSFVDSLKQLCQKTSQFILELKDVEVYCNEEQTRTFLGLQCQHKDDLDCFRNNLDGLLAEYQLPAFYKDASYHISFFWSLGDSRTDFKSIVPFLSTSLNKFLAEYPEESLIHVNKLYCKIGNKLYVFPLK